LQAKVNDTIIDLPDTTNVEEGQPVVVGIRPEHLSLNADPGTSALPISLDLVETLGSEALLHARFGEQAMIIKAETNGYVDHLSNVSTVHAPTNLVKVFDAESRLVLSEPFSPGNNA